MTFTTTTVVALHGLALLASPTSPAKDNTPVNFELAGRHLIVVRGGIGRLEGLRLLIDTGANPSMVDRRIAKKLALDIQQSEFIAFGQKTRVARTVLPDIHLGSFAVGAVPAGVGDLSFLHGVDAIVGLDVLSKTSFSIDYKQRQITFGPVDGDTPSIRLDANPPFLTIQLAIAGRPVRVLVDTGSDRLVLFERRMRDRLPPLALHGEQLLYHLAGTSSLKRVLLQGLDAGGQNLDRVEAFLSDAAVDGYPPGIDGVLGVRVLASKRADFDFERSRFGFR